MKVYISQPIHCQTEEERERVYERDKTFIRSIYPDAEFIDVNKGYQDILYPAGMRSGVYALGKMLELMADADLVWFSDGWTKETGCVVAHQVACAFGIKCGYAFNI